MRLRLIVSMVFAGGAALIAWGGAHAQRPSGPVDTVTKASRAEFDACQQAIKRACFKNQEMRIGGWMTKAMVGTCNEPLDLGRTKEGYAVAAQFNVIWTDAESFGKYGPPPFSGRSLLTDEALTGFRDLTYEEARAHKPKRDGLIDSRSGATSSTLHLLSSCIVKSAALAILDAYGNAEEKAVLAGAGPRATAASGTPVSTDDPKVLGRGATP